MDIVTKLLQISISLLDVQSVDKLSLDNSVQLLPNAISIRESSAAPHVFTSLQDQAETIAKLRVPVSWKPSFFLIGSDIDDWD